MVFQSSWITNSHINTFNELFTESRHFSEKNGKTYLQLFSFLCHQDMYKLQFQGRGWSRRMYNYNRISIVQPSLTKPKSCLHSGSTYGGIFPFMVTINSIAL